MPEKGLYLIASSILAGSGLVALAVVGVGGWYFLTIPVVGVAAIMVMVCKKGYFMT